MDIVVRENHAVRECYSWAKMLRLFYVVSIIIALGGLLTRDPWFIIPFTAQLYVFGILFMRPIRFTSFSDDGCTAIWPKAKTVSYDQFSSMTVLNPYEEVVHFVFIVYKRGLLVAKFNLCWIPADQGILQHLKAHGVKVRNLWFWQEKD